MKLAGTLLILAFIASTTGFMAYVGLKHGVLWDKFGRVAARREDSALIFWTLWSVTAATSFGSLAGLLFLAGLEFFG